MPRGPWTDERRAKQAATIAARKASYDKDMEEGRRAAIADAATPNVLHDTVAARKATKEVMPPVQSTNTSTPDTRPVRATQAVSVTYRPYDGDPHTVKWNGIQFRANVPVTLDRANREHHIEQLLPKQFPGTNGETLTKHIPAMMFMGDMARTNPSFEVDGERARRLINTRVVPAPGQEWSEAHEGQISESDIIDDFASAYQMQGQPRQAGRA